MSIDPQDEMLLFQLARRTKRARDANRPLEVSPEEMQLLRLYCDNPQDNNMLWQKARWEAFKDALPALPSGWPWESPTKPFYGIPIVVRHRREVDI
jgi:hypothetical protein